MHLFMEYTDTRINTLGAVSRYFLTEAPYADANARLQLHSENSKSKQGHNYVKSNSMITSPTGMGFTFDSEQLISVSSKYLQ